ncbi:MAG TPA: MaoC/PaaZ C-terminal domain-containing protein [Rubrobacter sp.]|nr:MaoC/PaaZ C-terminal domain-containing protein [Rubrobacter sp.]
MQRSTDTNKAVDRTIPLEVGDSVAFSKTIGESDVYLFAGITGDFSPNHVNKEVMSGTPYKERIAHGVLSIGFASTTSTLMIEKSGGKAVSLGYDRIRFVGPIFIGDTITVTYTISEIDEENLRTRANIEVANQRGEVCTVAQHILKFLA